MCFNKSLDSRLPHRRSYDLDKFEQEILAAAAAYPPEKVDASFDMKSRVIECIIASKGSNEFEPCHTVKKVRSKCK